MAGIVCVASSWLADDLGVLGEAKAQSAVAVSLGGHADCTVRSMAEVEEAIRMERVLRRWAARHPAPDMPAFVLRGRRLSPRQVAGELAAGAPIGRQVLAALRDVADEHGIAFITGETQQQGL
jgi:hypothetical protein